MDRQNQIVCQCWELENLRESKENCGKKGWDGCRIFEVELSIRVRSHLNTVKREGIIDKNKAQVRWKYIG